MSDVAAYSLMLLDSLSLKDAAFILLGASFGGLVAIAHVFYKKWQGAEDEVLYLRARLSFSKGVPNDRFL